MALRERKKDEDYVKLPSRLWLLPNRPPSLCWGFEHIFPMIYLCSFPNYIVNLIDSNSAILYTDKKIWNEFAPLYSNTFLRSYLCMRAQVGWGAEGEGEADFCWAGKPTQGLIPGPRDHDLSQRQMLNWATQMPPNYVLFNTYYS